MPRPFYLLEEKKLRKNLALIADIQRRAGVEFILAYKAYALWRTFPIFREYICSTTASSPWEARLAREEFGALAHTYSPAYEEETFEEIVRSSSHITFNSLTQYARFAPLAAGRHLGLRVNPEYSEIETELYNPCAPGSRFGVLPEALAAHGLPKEVSGFHVHNHCESSAEAFARSLAVIEERFGKWFPQLQWINFGGGHLVTRQDYNVPLLIETLQAFRRRHPHLHIILEPGSAFGWQTGLLVSHVVDIVENHGVRTALLNVSFTCHMPDCLEMPYMPAVRGAEVVESSTGQNVYRLGGNSCLSGDFLSAWRFPKPLAVGDEVIFEDMLHYTTVKTTMFNGVAHPDLVLERLDGTRALLRRFTYADWRDRMD